jgi:hypothetical protein
MKHQKKPEGNVRHVVSNGLNIRGIITNKAGRTVQFESWTERSLLLRLDRDPTVTDYGSQPEVFRYTDPQGKWHTYTPDFIVWRLDGWVEIHEVTLSKRRKRSNIRQREAAAVEICQERGWRYLVHTEQTLPQGSELANLLALFRYRPTIYAEQTVAKWVDEQLSLQQSVPLGRLVEHLVHDLRLPQPNVVAGLGHMLWHGQLTVNLHRLIFVDGAIAPDVLVWLTLEQEARDGSAA